MKEMKLAVPLSIAVSALILGLLLGGQSAPASNNADKLLAACERELVNQQKYKVWRNVK